jgi:hypothetical protein
VLVNNLAATATSYTDTKSLAAGTTYYYEVMALNHTTASSPSNVASAATWPTAPSQPSGLTGAGVYNTANPSQGAINLVWQDKSSIETGYSVERSTDNKTWTVLTSTLAPNSTSYSDTGLTLGTTYYYRVRCFNGPSASPYSSTINVAATPTAPAQPSNLTAVAVSGTQINLTWQDKAINATSYSVEWSTDNKTWTVLTSTPASNATSYSDTSGLKSSTTYYYRVRAFDGPSLASSYTSTVSITTPAQGPLPSEIAGPEDIIDLPTGKDRGKSKRF